MEAEEGKTAVEKEPGAPAAPGSEAGHAEAPGAIGGRVLAFGRRLYVSLDRRIGVNAGLLWARSMRFPRRVNFTLRFGTVALFLLLVQGVTGIFLAVYYRGAPDQAYESVRFVMTEVTLGWLVRGVHRWAGELLLLAVGLHVIRIFLKGAFKSPRELNWVAGGLLLFLLIGFRFTGQILPWDQHALWSTVSGIEIVKAFPVAGHLLLGLLWGGETVDGTTLARFYTAHVLIFPWITFFLLGLHFLLAKRLGISRPS
ncbi:MAG: cytochrome b N-terminal domain-containing protein [Planctomycetota bacterium]|jgi:quinol-cytochrome oxidoreductase complex cytochrome b subunit